MSRFLMILEVSQKQAYIFGSRKLRQNLLRSNEIRYATSCAFFKQICPGRFSPEENLVYTGGGHTVLQFSDQEQALAFSRDVTMAVLTKFPGMELFVQILPYNPACSPGENLHELSRKLEEKKARRISSFRQLSFGMEQWAEPRHAWVPEEDLHAPEGWQLTDLSDRLAGEDHFLAVVHIDGNAMSARVQNIYGPKKKPCGPEASDDWEQCVQRLRSFSEGVDRDFADAYQETANALAASLSPEEKSRRGQIFPMRRIIGAGDDVCFLTAGSLGLECAARFLQSLSQKRNQADGLGYPACAGVVLVHQKYPFRAAYDLSEALCSNAKRFGARLDPESQVSVIDWHLELGQLKGSLSQIREDYRTRDGGRLELRPMVVVAPDHVETAIPPERSYAYFRAVMEQFQGNLEQLPRSKVKQLREALRQGECETKLALRQMQLEELLWRGLEQRFPDWIKQALKGKANNKEAFFNDSTTGDAPIRRCLYFDAIEMMDHMTLLGRGDA